MKTPQQSFTALARALGSTEVYLKREDLHPYGSHKGRSIPHMIKHYVKEGHTHFAISSSGNAALAAIRAVQKYNENNEQNITLRVLVGNHIDEKKLQTLTSDISSSKHITLEQVERPKQAVFQLEKSGEATSLRQSTDDLALEGYYELGAELAKIPNLSAVFVPTSSGTTAQALGQYVVENNLPIAVHIVQTESCHPIADTLGAPSEHEEASIAGAIVDMVAHRKQPVVDIVKQTGGTGWIASNDEIKEAIRLVKETTDIDISPNSALAIAGAKKAALGGVIACLITGA